MTLLRRTLCLLALLLGGLGHALACSSAGCVSAGPRLASVDSTRGPLLNALLGNLTGSTLNLSVADWNSLATADVSLLRTVNALQATVNASSPASTLATNATVAQILTAATTGATAEGKTALAVALNALAVSLNGLSTPIQLGQLLVSDGVLGTTRINALDLVTGVLQLYNARNVVTTPAPITLSGSSLGLGALLGTVSLAAQVVEPPVIVCGPVGSTFHSAAIRVKLNIDLISINLDVSLLTALLGGSISANVGHLDLYAELARTDGIITAVNALTNAITVQATPGVAALYLGSIPDSAFFNRSHALVASDVDWGVIGNLTIGAITVDIKAKATAIGSAPSPTTLNFTGAYPQSFTVYTNAGFATGLVTTLISNLQLSVSPGLLNTVVNALLPVLKTILQLVLPGTVGTLVDSVLNPLLDLLGIRLGETTISAGGTALMCMVSGLVYDDANHTSKYELGEVGTGATLYAKLVPTTQAAGPAIAVAAVDPSTGAYSFPSVAAASYAVIINGTSAAAQITPAGPAGWLPTEAPTLTRNLTLSTADITAQRFGLYHGSQLTGTVFKDNGSGAGTAHNGVRDGTEAAVVGATVKVTDNAGSTVYDTATSGDAGGYTLWVPHTAGAATLKVTHTPMSASWVAVSGVPGTTAGSFALATRTVTFTQAIGSSYSGVNFGDVPANAFAPDGQQTVLAGTVAFYPHAFTAGTAGTVSLATSGPAVTGWGATVYQDANCNGRIDSGDLQVTAALAVVADQKVCLVVKVVTPAGVADNTQYPLSVTAHFAYAGSALAGDLVRNDLTTIGMPTDAGLRLVKTVDKASAASGDFITYTLTYSNLSQGVLAAIKIADATPAYTVFSSASCGAMPSVAISCAVSAQPAAGVAGRVEWTFTGPLASGASGTVSLVVKLQ